MHASTASTLAFYIWVQLGVPCSPIQASCNLCLTSVCWVGPLLSLKVVILEYQLSPGLFFPPEWFPVDSFFQADFWRDCSLLIWNPCLWSCYLPCSCLLGSWTPTYQRASIFVPHFLFLNGAQVQDRRYCSRTYSWSSFLKVSKITSVTPYCCHTKHCTKK